MNKLVEPVTVERVLDEIEDEVTLIGMAHAPPPRVRSRATIPIALIVPAIFFGGLVVVLLLRGDPVTAIRGSGSAVDQPAPSKAAATAAVQDPLPASEPIAQSGEPTASATKGLGVATSEDIAAAESQSALLRFMARGTVRDLPAPRRAGPAAPADAMQVPASSNADANGRAAAVSAAAGASGNAVNSATVASAASAVGNANINPSSALAAGKGTAAAPDSRAVTGADGASTVQVAAQAAQQAAASGSTQSTAQGAAPNAAGSAAPIAAAVIPTPPPAPLRPIEQPSPVFPVDAMRDGIRSGRVLAALTVAPDGSVSNVRVLEVAPNASFSRAAQRALRNWRFAATGTGGQATIELLFKSEE